MENLLILKVLKTKESKLTQEQFDQMQDLGIKILLDQEMSSQGYAVLEKNDRQLVISKDRSNKSGLFAGYSYITSFQDIAKVDFMNYFNKNMDYKIDRKNYERQFTVDNNVRQYRDARYYANMWDREAARYTEELQKIQKQIDNAQRNRDEYIKIAETILEKVGK